MQVLSQFITENLFICIRVYLSGLDPSHDVDSIGGVTRELLVVTPGRKRTESDAEVWVVPGCIVHTSPHKRDRKISQTK